MIVQPSGECLLLRFLQLPSDMKALVELTEETGHENGGQTIDWLLKMGMGTERILNFKQEPHSQNAGQTVNLSPPTETRSLIELTREMGFNKGGETVDWMLGMATNPMLEAINLLGFKDGAKTIEWLISQAQPSINAAIMNRSNIQERPSLLSAMNIPPQFPPIEFDTPTLQPRGERAQFHNFTPGPLHQFQGTGQRLGEMQQQVQFQSNGSGHQYLNANGGFLNQSSGFKRKREEAEYSYHAGNQLQTQYPSGHRRRQATTKAITHIERATGNSAQGLGQTPISGVHAGGTQGFHNGPTDLAGMPLEIHVEKNSIIMGNTGQQSDFLKHFSDPKALLDFYFANYNLYDNIRPQNQLENIHAQNQNQKQFVNINEQNQNQNKFANIHYQNQTNLAIFSNIARTKLELK